MVGVGPLLGSEDEDDEDDVDDEEEDEEEQLERIGELAKALLREFMHKRGYKETLKAFDAECPRGSGTLDSRPGAWVRHASANGRRTFLQGRESRLQDCQKWLPYIYMCMWCSHSHMCNGARGHTHAYMHLHKIN